VAPIGDPAGAGRRLAAVLLDDGAADLTAESHPPPRGIPNPSPIPQPTPSHPREQVS
jgi:hypothetical protein